MLVHRNTRRVLDAEEHIGHYGPGRRVWDEHGDGIVYDRVGVITDHVASFVEAGGSVRNGATVVWAVLPDGKAHKVLCGEIIPVATEDGPSDGRCGFPVRPGEVMCEGHL